MGTNIVGYALVIGPKIKYPLVGALVLLPYLDRSRQGVGRWFARERVLANAVFTVCLVVAIVLTIIGTSFRGYAASRFMPHGSRFSAVSYGLNAVPCGIKRPRLHSPLR